MNAQAFPVQTPVPGRACGSCNLCCKVYDGPYPGKAAGQWCRHCTPGRAEGCAVYDARPQGCRDFHCLWMTAPWLGDEWKPERSRMVATFDPAAKALLVQVDPGAANAWRREPYLGQLRAWAKAGWRERRHVVVFVNRHATVVTPDREEAIGTLEPGDRIVVRERRGEDGKTGYEVVKAKLQVPAA